MGGDGLESVPAGRGWSADRTCICGKGEPRTFHCSLLPSIVSPCGSYTMGGNVMDRRVQAIINIIERDMGRDLPLEALAAHVNLSPSRLSSIFKMEMGISVKQYLKSRRLVRARGILENTFLSIKETMASVGISDESHFVRDFEKEFGLSPSRYRAMYSRCYSERGIIVSANE